MAVVLVLNEDSIDPGMAALSVTFALALLSEVGNWIAMLTEFEINIVAAERIEEYSHIDQEVRMKV